MIIVQQTIIEHVMSVKQKVLYLEYYSWNSKKQNVDIEMNRVKYKYISKHRLLEVITKKEQRC
jgi:hypothetical protein